MAGSFPNVTSQSWRAQNTDGSVQPNDDVQPNTSLDRFASVHFADNFNFND